MAENPFKPGDIVECIDDVDSKRPLCGLYYTVEKCTETMIWLKEIPWSWYTAKRFRLVSRPSDEWRNGDDVEWDGRKFKYVGPDPCYADDHVCREIVGGRPMQLISLGVTFMRRPKPARTIEELVGHLGEDNWTILVDSVNGDGGWSVRLWMNCGPTNEEEYYFKKKDRQACIDAAWELLVNEDVDW